MSRLSPYLGINLWFQLELTRAQIPLQRLGKVVEQLTSMLALCHHATALQDDSQTKVAALQCEQLAMRGRCWPGSMQMDRLRALVGTVGDDIEKGQSTLLTGVQPQPFAHPFDAPQRKKEG